MAYSVVEQKYELHDNGGRPFTVTFKDDIVIVNSNSSNWQKTFYPINVFIGHSPVNAMTLFSGGHGPEFEGNTILLEGRKLHDGRHEYTFLGHELYTFVSKKVVRYVSPVGNNDVPYPFAIDVDGNYILLLENVIISAKDKLTIDSDPYRYYYDSSLITSDFLDITEFYIGDDKYTFRYTPSPEDNYDRLIFGLGPIKIVYRDGREQLLDKKQYTEIMDKYGKLIGATKLETVKIPAS